MSIYSLHPIELQLIAQFLPIREILSFARRCRFTLAALDSPFTFRCDPLKLETKLCPPGAFSANCQLTRHVLVSLVWSPRDPAAVFPSPCSAADVDQLLSMAATPVSTVGLDATQWVSVAAQCSSRLLSAPCFSQLRELRLNRVIELSEPGINTIGAMTQLRSLGIYAASPAVLKPLKRLPHLTDLTVRIRHEHFAATLECISDLAGLRRLQLDRPYFDGGSWLPFWTAMRQLESVTIEAWQCDPDDGPPITDENFEDAFRAMNRLQSFTIREMWNVDRMLSHIHHACSLRQLHVMTDCNAYDPYDECNSLPSSDVLRELLNDALELIVSVEIRTGSWPGDRQGGEAWRSQYDGLQKRFRERLQIELTLRQG